MIVHRSQLYRPPSICYEFGNPRSTVQLMDAFVYCWRCWWGSLSDFVSPFWRNKLINPRRKPNKQCNEARDRSLISSPRILFCHHHFGQPNFDWFMNEPTLLGRLTLLLLVQWESRPISHSLQINELNIYGNGGLQIFLENICIRFMSNKDAPH